MARLGRGGFLALAVLFHFIYLWSIFDIYFVSPIVHGMRAYQVERPEGKEAPAKRLVLYVGDGLRADKAFQSFPDPSPPNGSTPDLTPLPLAPFLRSQVLSHGTFGVSHTRMPTESRPGHVALIAGMYEDVAAVTTGWKLNPVDFDSVFNRSRHTWSWGSPDILPMFKEGAVPGRIDADTYGHEFEDFTQDATALDTWVFNKVKELFTSAKTNSTLDAALREDKVVFFLHLLGLDTTGHAYRPYSKEYLHNIKIVDQGVQEITKLIDNFYNDGKTAYVFTADHGMSDWGSHGDGHPDNTRTPLIAWGAGVASPKLFQGGIAPGHEDEFSSGWNLDQVQRHDVAQADIAALMAYLAGLEFPVNSVGELPLSYLAATPSEKAEAALVNTREVLEMYKVKEEHKKATALRYSAYPPFAQANQSHTDRIALIESAIKQDGSEHAIVLSNDLLHHAIQGLRYLQTYDWLFLRALITAGYLGFMAYAATTVIDLHVLHGSSSTERTSTSTVFFSSILVLLYTSFVVERSPLMYYAYAIFPVLFWEEVFARRQALLAGTRVLLDHVQGTSGYLAFAAESAVFVAVLQALVYSYFHRIIFTVCYIIGAAWPLIYGSTFCKQNIMLISSWATGCIALSTFTMLPVIKIESANMITAGGALMFSAGLTYLLFEHSITVSSLSGRSSRSQNPTSRIIMGAQLGVVLLTILVTRSSIASLQAKSGLPLGNQLLGWLCLTASLVLPFVHRIAPNSHYLHRLVVIFLAFSPSFILLSISYEGLFYFFFCGTLLAWVRLEHAIYEHTTSLATPTLRPATSAISTVGDDTEVLPADLSPDATHRTLMLPDLRTSLFFLFLLQSAFFSTGNIASISSFSLDAVYRLIPIFDPFSQGALLMFKILVPFAIISANLGILNRRLGLKSSALFMVVMAISDVMTIRFFFMVRDEGSWLDIGTTISHFVIGSLLSVFVAGLEPISEVLISGVDVVGDGVLGGEAGGNGKVVNTQNGTVKQERRVSVVKQDGRMKHERRVID